MLTKPIDQRYLFAANPISRYNSAATFFNGNAEFNDCSTADPLLYRLTRRLNIEHSETVEQLRAYHWATLIAERKYVATNKLRYQCSLNWLAERTGRSKATLRRNQMQRHQMESGINQRLLEFETY